jgi:hypothetical protein
MKLLKVGILFITMLLCSHYSFGQFTPTNESKITIIVTDGTVSGKDSPLNVVGGQGEGTPFTAPIKALGMTDAIQAGAFLDRPRFGKAGFLLIFSVSDSIGGKQGTLMVNGRAVKGVYRLVRQKMRENEPVPEGMTTYRITGTIYILGIS